MNRKKDRIKRKDGGKEERLGMKEERKETCGQRTLQRGKKGGRKDEGKRGYIEVKRREKENQGKQIHILKTTDYERWEKRQVAWSGRQRKIESVDHERERVTQLISEERGEEERV